MIYNWLFVGPLDPLLTQWWMDLSINHSINPSITVILSSIFQGFFCCFHHHHWIWTELIWVESITTLDELGQFEYVFCWFIMTASFQMADKILQDLASPNDLITTLSLCTISEYKLITTFINIWVKSYFATNDAPELRNNASGSIKSDWGSFSPNASSTPCFLYVSTGFHKFWAAAKTSSPISAIVGGITP